MAISLLFLVVAVIYLSCSSHSRDIVPLVCNIANESTWIWVPTRLQLTYPHSMTTSCLHGSTPLSGCASGKQRRSLLMPWTPTSHNREARRRWWKSPMILQPHMLQTKHPFSCCKQIKVHQVGPANLMIIFPTITHMSIFLLLNMLPLIQEKSIVMCKNCRKHSVALVSSAHVPLGSSRQLPIHMANTKACNNGSCPEWKSECYLLDSGWRSCLSSSRTEREAYSKFGRLSQQDKFGQPQGVLLSSYGWSDC